MNSNKAELINFRATRDEKEALHILSSLERRTKSEMMRELIREGLRNRGLDIYNMSENIPINRTKVAA
jgi:hypothetical protein